MQLKRINVHKVLNVIYKFFCFQQDGINFLTVAFEKSNLVFFYRSDSFHLHSSDGHLLDLGMLQEAGLQIPEDETLLG
jgi:hypothetical protein